MPKTFLIAFHGETTETATPLLYVDDPDVVRTLSALLMDRADGGAGFLPDVRLNRAGGPEEEVRQ